MEDQIWEADWNSVSTSLLGRSLDALLGSRQRELDAVLSRTDLKSGRKSGSGLLPSTDGPLDDALLFLHKYVKDCVGRSEPMDHILVPIIESAVKLKGSKRFKQMLGIVQRLFEDDELFLAFANYLVGIITRKVDHFISLGWCALVRGLVSLEFSGSRLPEVACLKEKGSCWYRWMALFNLVDIQILFQDLGTGQKIGIGSVIDGLYRLPVQVVSALISATSGPRTDPSLCVGTRDLVRLEQVQTRTHNLPA
ncbi:uncharacterized protein LOC116255718 isoform X3 [Nymphaea colorata]|uniref:uncharacterized protein LOC116255718 isoform X3 n=1 Tax=Nymphaea colorata TaxID=210225 RepID=UPI00214EC1A5|nr:uncharacterized protein LOC116255718 isoform X3 [Nymphaea colorata]